MFPEAGISFSYAVRSLMPGVASLARETGAPVVPVVQWGIHRIYSVGRKVDGREPGPDWTRGRLNDLRFGAPMTAAPGDDLTAWTRELGATLTGMLEEIQQLPEHRPRAGRVRAVVPRPPRRARPRPGRGARARHGPAQRRRADVGTAGAARRGLTPCPRFRGFELGHGRPRTSTSAVA